jgi:hypothetical protein
MHSFEPIEDSTLLSNRAVLAEQLFLALSRFKANSNSSATIALSAL